MDATSTATTTEGSFLKAIAKRLRNLRDKHKRILKMEENLHDKTLNKDQQDLLHSKPTVLARIDELQMVKDLFLKTRNPNPRNTKNPNPNPKPILNIKENEMEAGENNPAVQYVYMFYSHDPGSSEMGYTFFAIPIPIPTHFTNPIPIPSLETEDEIDDERARITFNKLDPILEFPASEYPSYMSCAQLGSCFYFLGGEFCPSEDDNSGSLPVLPSDVYVFDTAPPRAERQLKKLKHGMKTGKPRAYCFVADEMLFVLANFNNGEAKRKVADFGTPITLVEVYNPVTEKWRVLEGPSGVKNPTLWKAVFIKEHPRKVYVYCRDFGCDVFQLLFDLDNKTWSHQKSFYTPIPSGLVVGNSDYHISYCWVMHRDFKDPWPPKKEGDTLKLKWFSERICVLHGNYLINGTNARLCHLGNRTFCVIGSDAFYKPPPEIMTVENQRRLSVAVFRDTMTPVHYGGGGEEEEEQNEDATVERLSEMLFTDYYIFKSDYSNAGRIDSCFAPSIHP